MTPEELNRTIEFIIQSQTRLAAAQEQDREERIQFQKESKAFDRRLANIVEMQVRLLESQTRRLDAFEKENRAVQRRHEELHEEFQTRHEELHENFLQFMRETQDWQQRFHSGAQKQHEEAVAWFQRILERLTDRLN